MIRIELSVVIPVLDERPNLTILYRELKEVLEELGKAYEIIFVDDGSKDGSREVLRELANNDPRTRVVIFKRNYGQTAALSAGFKQARGEMVISLDADLQNDPHDIPAMLAKLEEGYDLVNGWRKNRDDNYWTRILPSRAANRIINKLIEGTRIQLNDYGCTLKAYRKSVVKDLRIYGEMHRFIPVFAAWLGARICEMPVNHRPRMHGRSKYNLSRVTTVLLDLLVVRFFSDFMTRPIQFFGKIAKFVFTMGMGFLVFLGLCNLLFDLPVTLNTLLILAGILLAACLQFIIVGLIGEIQIRSYFETQDKDQYVIDRTINP